MSIPTYAELREALIERADVLGHPTKGNYQRRGGDTGIPHRFGSRNGTVVYFAHGDVGGRFDGAYLVARGDDHQDSVLALAHHLGVTELDNGVAVDEIDGGTFWTYCLPEGYTLPGG